MSGNGDDDGRSGNGDRSLLQMDLLGDDRIASDENGDSPHFRISPRAKRISIRVYPDARVEVVVPPRAKPRDIEAFVSSQREWIETRRAQALRNKPVPEPFPPPTLDFLATGERWRVHLAGETAGRYPGIPTRHRVVERGAGLLEISGAGAGRTLRVALRNWLKRAAAERLEPRVAEIAAAAGVKYSRVEIRRQRSRWGSCSARGTISLNLCLLFQRPEVVDYLIIHELMHVKHMNHSARFWAAVESHCADWRALDRELLNGWRTVPRWVFSDH